MCLARFHNIRDLDIQPHCANCILHENNATIICVEVQESKICERECESMDEDLNGEEFVKYNLGSGLFIQQYKYGI